MNIEKNSWHYKVFTWYLTEKYGYVPSKYEDGTNLCPYVRAILLWAPLVFVFTPPRLWVTLPAILAAITGVVYKFHGLHGLKVEATVLLVIFLLAAFIASIVGIVIGIGELRDYLRRKNVKVVPTAVTSFGTVLKEYVKGIHDNICPQVKFIETEIIDLDKK